MTAAQFELLDEAQAQRILSWRFEALTQAGYDASDALVLATRVEVDLHMATNLLKRGCPVSTALRILL
jgi:hypothetical protein